MKPYKRYNSYKEAGVAWLEEIPEHWEVLKVKHVGSINPSKNNPKTACLKDKLVVFLPMERVHTDGTIDQEIKLPCSQLKNGYTYFEENDILIAKVTPCFENGKIIFVKNLATPVGFGSTEFIVIRPNLQKVAPRFLFYLLYNEPLRSIGKHFMTSAVGLKRVPTEFVENFPIPIPTEQEQIQIANFLDHKTGHIDELIRIKERRIELLQEQRITLINQAVTKGLDPNVEMKPSGVEWIGEIPGHWTISKVKHVFNSLDNLRIPLNSETRGNMELKVYDYYGASGVIDKVENYIFDEPLILIGEDGANLYLRSTPLAFKATGKYWVNNHAHVLKPKCGNIDYLTNMLESLDYTHYITGAAQPKLTSEHLMNIAVINPPPLEQTQIANFLGHKTQQIDELISEEQRKIELLKEYRQSLIFEAVTGKINVRGAM